MQQNTQPMQFSPWQFGASLPQGIAWATPQPPALLTTQNPIFIRGTTQTEGTAPPPMFIQSPPPQAIHTQHRKLIFMFLFFFSLFTCNYEIIIWGITYLLLSGCVCLFYIYLLFELNYLV